jgi:hypothetical protein
MWQNRANATLDNFVIVGNDVRIISSGKLIGGRGIPLSDYGVYFESRINTKNDAMSVFDKFGWSSSVFDYYGYKIGPRIVIRGRVGEPDFSEIQKLLASAEARVLLKQGEDELHAPILNQIKMPIKIFKK